MPIKKKPTKKPAAKKRTTKPRVSGIAAYTRKIQNSVKVKSATNKIKELEKKILAAKKIKAAAVKEARKKMK
jgi:hypothetical protein